MRVKNLILLSVFLSILLLVPSVKAYLTNTDEGWDQAYFPDGEITETGDYNDTECNQTYLIDNNILDIDNTWNMCVCVRKYMAGSKFAIMVANKSGDYRGLFLQDTKLYLRDFSVVSSGTLVPLSGYPAPLLLISTKDYDGDDLTNFFVYDTYTHFTGVGSNCNITTKGVLTMVDMGDMLSCPITAPLCGQTLGVWHTWYEHYFLVSQAKQVADYDCSGIKRRFLTDYTDPDEAVVWEFTAYPDPTWSVNAPAHRMKYLPSAVKPFRWWFQDFESSSGGESSQVYRSFYVQPTACSIGDFSTNYSVTYTKDNSESIYWYYQQTGQNWKLIVNYADPISSEAYGDSYPPETPNATQIDYFNQGIEAVRRYCPIDNKYYWVNYTASFSRIVKYNPVNFVANYYNPDTGGFSIPTGLNVNLECPAETWSDNYTFTTANYYALQTPCRNDNRITIGGDYIPSQHVISDYDIPSVCDTSTILIEVLKPYEVTITARDSISGDTISGANISMNNFSAISDGEGEVSFTINPYTTSRLDEVYGYPECQRKFVVDGTKRIFTLIANKTGYNPASDSVAFLEDWWSGEYTHIKKTATIYMEEISTKVTIHLKTTDGVEFYPVTGKIYAYDGDSGIKYHYKSRIYNQSIGYNFPAKFIFYDTRAVFNITFSLIYAGSEYNKTYEVEQNRKYAFDLYIDKSSAELPCKSISDCPSSFCKTNIYNKLVGCVNNICAYRTEICALCDDLIGCYDYIPAIEVSCTYDGDCLELTYCDNNLTSIQGLCGSEGICLIKRVLCPDYCDNATGLCHYYKDCSVWRPLKFWAIDGIRAGETEGITLYEQGFKCGLNNVGTRTCIAGMNISRAEYPTLGYTPKSWITETAGETGNKYTYFYDYSIYCNYFCEMEVEYCQHGCSITTGECLGKPDDWGSQAGTWFNSIGMAIATMFPTPAHRYIFSTIIMVVVGIGAGFLTKQAVIGGLGMFGFCLMFLAVGWLPAWIIFIFIVLGAFAVYKMMWGE